MPKDAEGDQYTPKGNKIPVPMRADFDANLDKLIKAPQPPARFRKKPSADRPASRSTE